MNPSGSSDAATMRSGIQRSHGDGQWPTAQVGSRFGTTNDV